jgi:Flp pilus assembly protein TadG
LTRNENGSAVVEFVMMAIPVVLVPIVTISITLNAYLRLVLTDAAVEGARVAALADQTLIDGANRSKEIIRSALGRDLQPRVEVRAHRNSEGVSLISLMVQVDNPIPVAVTSHALGEIQK